MSKQSDKGFSFIEVLVAKTILLFILVLFIPIYTTVSYEHVVLKSRLLITSSLQDYLLAKTLNKETFTNFTNNINDEHVEFSFGLEERYVKGCAKWKNQQSRKEEICLYGLDTK